MEILDPTLGNFSVLPPEVRIMIWKEFSNQLHTRETFPKKPDIFSPYQQILYTSHRICAEISAEVPTGYNSSVITIDVDPTRWPTLWFRARSNENRHRQMQWNIKDLPDATSRMFFDLRWDKIICRINIYPPEQENVDQLIHLYTKMRSLVKILKTKGLRNLGLDYKHTGARSWFEDGGPQQSNKNMIETLPWTPQFSPPVFYDYELILVLFTQLRVAKRVRILSSEMRKGKEADQRMKDLFALVVSIIETSPPHGSSLWQSQTIGRLTDERLSFDYMWVESKLDVLPSKTASMLRLERFSSWYTDEQDGNSPYEDEYLEAFHSAGGLSVDFMLKLYRKRRGAMMAYGPLSNGRNWDRNVWHRAYPHGIPPFGR